MSGTTLPPPNAPAAADAGASSDAVPEVADTAGDVGGDTAAFDAMLVQSRDAFVAEQWQEALEPTRQLVRRFPGQHVYLARLAEIYRQLGRPADEAATWEIFMDRAPLPADLRRALAALVHDPALADVPDPLEQFGFYGAD